MAKNKSNTWAPETLPKPQADTRTAAAVWISALSLDFAPLEKLCAQNDIRIDAKSGAFSLQNAVRECFPDADIDMARALVKHAPPYEDITDELLDEIMSATHTEGYEIIPWRETVLRVLATEFLGALRSSSAQLTEDAIVRVTSMLDEKLRGSTKNACQLISGQRTRLRKEVRMLTLAMLYLMHYRKETPPEDVQADVMQLVRTCPDPEFIVGEFPFQGFALANGDINARGRFAFCETLKIVRKIKDKRDSLDEIIQNSSKRWRISRMSLIDLNILRLAAYEICFERMSAPRVLINEAVELAKIFGAEQSKNFVNGILQQLCNDNDIAVS